VIILQTQNKNQKNTAPNKFLQASISVPRCCCVETRVFLNSLKQLAICLEIKQLASNVKSVTENDEAPERN